MSRNKPSAAQAAGNDTNLGAGGNAGGGGNAGASSDTGSNTGGGAGGGAASGAEQAKAREPQKPTIGRIVIAHFPVTMDGELEAAAIVAKVNDDGSLNLRVFAPNGGADIAATGVRSVDEAGAMDEGADKNAATSCTWSWPARN